MASATVYIREISTNEVVAEIECSYVGTSSYLRFLNGLSQKVDLKRGYIDSEAADKMHDELIGAREKAGES
jgi:hypothetical protein